MARALEELSPASPAENEKGGVASAMPRKTPVRVDPDTDFIRELGQSAGRSYEKCFQCGTCSGTCSITPDVAPFPRKEMAWANWGMKQFLIGDPDIWLCYQCQDCSLRCPRGARPGDLLGVVRQMSIAHHSYPRFLGRWVSQPQSIPLLLGFPALLLTLLILLKEPLASALGISSGGGDRIIYSYSSLFPHWLLNGFFLLFVGLSLIAMVIGVMRFWRSLKQHDALFGHAGIGKERVASITAGLRRAILHEDFDQCTSERTRHWWHMGLFFGFAALTLVTFWVITAGINPFIQGEFVYPFSFLSPWKILANLGGVAVLGGCFMMAVERFREEKEFGRGNYFDWALISAVMLVVITGFATEILHYVRLEPHRHLAYFVHLVFAFALLVYLPYSKLAHVVYRTVALIFQERTGRRRQADAAAVPPEDTGERGELTHA